MKKNIKIMLMIIIGTIGAIIANKSVRNKKDIQYKNIRVKDEVEIKEEIKIKDEAVETKEEKIYLKKIDINLGENNMEVYDRLVKDSLETEEFKNLKDIYENKLCYLGILPWSSIPKDETLKDLAQKINKSLEIEWDILPSTYKWEKLPIFFWLTTKEWFELKKLYNEKVASNGNALMGDYLYGSYQNMYDIIHKSVEDGVDYLKKKYIDRTKTMPDVFY